jgi:hypothetical protein
MKTKLLLFATLSLTLAAGQLSAEVWKRLPETEHDDVEASTPYPHLESTGSKVLSSKGISNPEAFISHDPVRRAKVQAGRSEVVISLGHQELVHGFTFANDGMEGVVRVEGSTDQKNWVNLESGAIVPTPSTPLQLTFLGQGKVAFSAADRFPAVEFAGMQLKYVRLSFDLARGGSMQNFEVFGTDNDADYKLVPAEVSGPSTEVNLADGIGGGRVIYVHPKPLNHEFHSTHHKNHQPFEFPESNEKYRTVIYDLGEPRKLSSFGSVHSPRPIRLSVFLFDTLEEKEDWRYRVTLDSAIFDQKEPAAVVEDKKGTGSVKVDLDGAPAARYVALRWEPDFNPPSFTVGGVLIASQGWMIAPAGGNAPGAPIVADPTAPFIPIWPMTGMLGTGGYAGGGGSLPPQVPTGTPPPPGRPPGRPPIIVIEPPAASP